jgi:general nucleoside transport system permease protein
VAFLLGGLQNAGAALQGPDFPSGLVGVMEGMILFTTLGGELFVRYRLRFTRKHHHTASTASAPEASAAEAAQ